MADVTEVENTFKINEDNKVTITLDEARLMVNVIEVVTKRGGFTPRDFTAVGKLYETMAKHLE